MDWTEGKNHFIGIVKNSRSLALLLFLSYIFFFSVSMFHFFQVFPLLPLFPFCLYYRGKVNTHTGKLF